MNPEGRQTFTFTAAELEARDRARYKRGYEKGARATLENLIQVVSSTSSYAKHLKTLLLRLYPEVGSLPGEQNGELAKTARAAGLGVRQLMQKARNRGVTFDEKKIILPLEVRDPIDRE